MVRPRIDRTEWREYLAGYHARFPGITEEILGNAEVGGLNPYQWVLDAVPPDARLLDIACGSGPLLSAGWSGPWVGLDRSRAELDLVLRRGNHEFVTGEADDLPFDDAGFDAVACSMALMLLDRLPTCLAEASRVLVPGGVMVVLLPGGAGPLTPGDLWRWTRLLVSIRRPRLTYPNDHEIRRLDHAVSATAFTVLSDERRRFAFPIIDATTARRFVDSLYLPRVAAQRIESTRRFAETWTESEIGIPLRRVVLRRRG